MGGRTKGGTQSLSPQGRQLKFKPSKGYKNKAILKTKRASKFKS